MYLVFVDWNKERGFAAIADRVETTVDRQVKCTALRWQYVESVVFDPGKRALGKETATPLTYRAAV